MASIHKDPRGTSPFWYCAYRLPNGKRTFRSTKQTDRKAAEEFCRRLEYASHESKAGRLTESRAHELISEIVEHATGEPLRNYTAEEWLREWLQRKKATKAEGTFLKYENAIKSFLASLGNRAKFNVNQIAPRDVLRCRGAEILDGKSPSTANDHVKIVRMAFTSARRQGFITHNPAEAVEMLPEDTDPARQPFSVEQVQAILRAAEGDWRGAIMVALYTGARLQDVVNMRWESVDLQNKWITFKVGKTKQRLKLPMLDALHEFLLELPAPSNGKSFLFPSLAGKGSGGKSGLSMAFAHYGAWPCARRSRKRTARREGSQRELALVSLVQAYAHEHHGECWCPRGSAAEVHRTRERGNESPLHPPRHRHVARCG